MDPAAITSIGLPLLASALMVVVGRRIRRSTAYAVMLAAIGLTAVLALASPPYPGDNPPIAIEWLPGAGAMGLSASASSVWVAFVTAAAGFLALLGTASRGEEFEPLSGAVLLLTLAATNTAFLADHFLARYVALEIVALCVALAPLVEVRGSAGIILASTGYLLLRIGDAGLLVAILILEDVTGTLSIGPALEHAVSAMKAISPTLNVAGLGCMVAGFVLAAWVKMGGWPFHLWSQAGTRLSLASQAWLYTIIVPNLGAYLLYRVTPLLAAAGPVRVAALWIGAAGSALAALMALTRPEPRPAMAFVVAAQGGLTLFAAAAGVKAAVWLGILILTPVQLLLLLAADATQNARSARWRGVGVSAFGLGGFALTAFSLLTTWWAREAGVSLDALFVAQITTALVAIWTVRACRRISRPSRRSDVQAAAHWTQGTTMGLLSGSILAGGLAFGPLVRSAATAAHLTLPALPTLLTLLSYAATSPPMLAVVILSLANWRLQGRSRHRPATVAGPEGEPLDLGKALTRAAQALRLVVEVGITEQIVALVVQVVMSGSRLAWAVEHDGLERFTENAARSTVKGAQGVYRAIEQKRLEGLLRRGVRNLLALSRILQRWHTGRLRRNLLWIPVALALAVSIVFVCGRWS